MNWKTVGRKWKCHNLRYHPSILLDGLKPTAANEPYTFSLHVCTVHQWRLKQDRTINVILAKHCIKLPDDGSLVIRNILDHF
jgi:hypothetical protein